MDVKITQRRLVWEVNNDKCHNYYYLVLGRFYNEDHTRYRKFKFVEWFDIFDVMEYHDKDSVTKSDILEMLNAHIDSRLSLIKGYDDCKEFYNSCNISIAHYNDLVNAYNKNR